MRFLCPGEGRGEQARRELELRPQGCVWYLARRAGTGELPFAPWPEERQGSGAELTYLPAVTMSSVVERIADG